MSEQTAENSDSVTEEALEETLDENLGENLADDSAESSPVEQDQDGPDSVQQRINEISREKNEAKAKAEAARLENQALQGRISALERVKAPEFTDSGAPKLEQFDHDPDLHQAALIEYEATKQAHAVISKQQAESQALVQQAEMDRQMQTHEARRAALRQKIPDLDVVLGQSFLNNQTQGGNAAVLAILQTGNSEDIEYHLAKNPELATRINNASPIAAAMEISTISERLVVKPKDKAALPDPVEAAPTGGGKSTTANYPFLGGATFK